MIVIAESELGIVCEARNCTRPAHYIVTIHAISVMHRLYCAQCTAKLLQGVAKVLEDNDDERPVNALVETVKLLVGEAINA